jgi:hypothetical protein
MSIIKMCGKTIKPFSNMGLNNSVAIVYSELNGAKGAK